MVDEAHDDGFMQEQFYGIVHGVDTTPLTLKTEIYYLFSNHCLDIQNILGQGYDGASNMRASEMDYKF